MAFRIDLAQLAPVCRLAITVEELTGLLWDAREAHRGTAVRVVSLLGEKMRSRGELFDKFGTLLEFPSYFGGNWNAFNDCISDLTWLRLDGLCLVIAEADVLLDAGDLDELALLVDILSDAALTMGSRPAALEPCVLRVILHTVPERAEFLSSRLGLRGLPWAPAFFK